jgi:predicted Zn-dependent protease with MMP-like domain
MTKQELLDIAMTLMAELPDPVVTALEDVNLLVCETPADAAAELRAEAAETKGKGDDEFEFTEEDAQEVSALDCKGVFVGTPTEVEDSDESEEEEVVYYPDGFIILIASNIESPDEAKAVLMHEIGHALGMDEAEVQQLGLGVGAQPKEGKEVTTDGTTHSSNG